MTISRNRHLPNLIDNSDTIIHLAGRAHHLKEASDDPLRDYRKANRDLTLNLARLALETKVKKFIYTSSVKVIGDKPGSYNEDDRPMPEDSYGISKIEAEQGLRELFENQSSTQCIIIRPPLIYGPRNKGNILSLIKIASKKMYLPLKNARGRRSMLYIGNLCDAILNIIQDKSTNRPSVQTYFLTDAKDVTSSKLYSYIFQAMHNKEGVFPTPELIFRLGGKAGAVLEKLTGVNLPLNQRVVSRLFDEYRFSNQKFCDDYKWSPPYTISQGIQNTVEWYNSIKRR